MTSIHNNLLVEGFINPFKSTEEEKLFIKAVKMAFDHCTKRFDDSIPKDSFGEQKTLDDKYPDKKKYISFHKYKTMKKADRLSKVFFSEEEETVTYKTKKTKQTITEKSNMYIMVSQTAEKSKEVATKFYIALAIFCKQLGIDYNRTEENGFDAIINRVRVELKIGQSSCASSIATGNNHSKIKVDCIVSIQFKMQGNQFTSLWVGLIDMGKKTSEDTKWSDDVSKSGKNNNGFSTLTVATEDDNIVKCLYGTKKSAQKYIHAIHESLV